MEFDIKIENIVAFVKFDNEIPLDKVTKKKNIDLPGVIYNVKDPSAAILIMPNGKIVCTNVKTVDDAVIALKKAVDRLSRAEIPLSGDIEMKVENIVAVAKVGSEFNLEEISITLPNCEYNPKKIKGIIYKLTDPKITMVLFRNGKVLCTHVDTIENIHLGLARLKRDLEGIGVSITPMLVE